MARSSCLILQAVSIFDLKSASLSDKQSALSDVMHERPSSHLIVRWRCGSAIVFTAVCCRTLANEGVPDLAPFRDRRLLGALRGLRITEDVKDAREIQALSAEHDFTIFLTKGLAWSAGYGCYSSPMPAPSMQAVAPKHGSRQAKMVQPHPLSRWACKRARPHVGFLLKPMHHGRLQAAAHCMCNMQCI